MAKEQTIGEFVAKYCIVATATRIPGRADVEPGEWERDARHWAVQLRRAPGVGRQGGPTMTVFFSQGSAHTKAPSAIDVLDCLASDVDGIDQPFESWASDLGYDPDSRKAERTYHAIKVQAARLESLLGAEGLAELLKCERL